MLTAQELRGQISPNLRGPRRTVIDGRERNTHKSTPAERANSKAQREKKAEAHRAYVRAYDAANREAANARVARYAKKRPERRALQLRAAATKYWHKKMAAIRYMALLIAFASSFGGAQ